MHSSLRWCALVLLLAGNVVFAQDRRRSPQPTPTPTPATPPAPAAPTPAISLPRTGPRPYPQVVTAKASTTRGLFTVHKIDDRYLFELPDSLLGREIMAITRTSKTATNAGYGGEQANRQVLRFERGPDNRVLMRAVQYINVGADSTQPIFKAVQNSNVQPIAAVFDVKAVRKDTSVVFDVTDFFKTDNQVISLPPFAKIRYRITQLQTDRTFIQTVKSFPINTEVRVMKTYSVTPPTPSFGGAPSPPSPFPTVSLPAGEAAGVATFEMNTSMILLPKVPMKKRLFDARVGYFANGYTVFDDNSQRTDDQTFAVRWRLEAKNAADEERQKRGELIEPKKPIVFYIDPATPAPWRAYLKMGVDDWQKAFEQAGWKNAIRGEILTGADTTVDLDDARFSAIRYFASNIENAYGPNVHDPRSGEILESHIGWYHNVMKLLKKWYMTQTAAADPRARKKKLDPELMGQLIRFVSSHEVGHTLGLRHNFGASSATPVEKLRDKAFIAQHGHTSSIMDYARFNYVAQPEDGVTDFFPRIGDYDNWAIEWAYKPIYGTKTPEDDKKILNQWYAQKVAPNRRLWFLTETNPYDPRAQSEDLGDNSLLSSEYGLKNLKRIVPNLLEWTREDGENYDILEESFNEVVGQFRRYIGHVTKNVGGIHETPKVVEQAGLVYEATPRDRQKAAVAFLNAQVFSTPTWLLNPDILARIRPDAGVDFVSKLQETTLNSLLTTDRLQRLIETTARTPEAYSLTELFTDVRTGIWAELKTRKPISIHRRNLQKIFVEKMAGMLNPPSLPLSFQSGPNNVFGAVVPPSVDPKKTDILSVTRANVVLLQSEIKAALPATTDPMTKYHLQDCLARISKALDPK